MNKLATALIAVFFSVSLAHAADQPPGGKQPPEKREKPDSARNAMLKERSPEQKKYAACSVKAGSEELTGKDREKFIDKCMKK